MIKDFELLVDYFQEADIIVNKGSIRDCGVKWKIMNLSSSKPIGGIVFEERRIVCNNCLLIYKVVT